MVLFTQYCEYLDLLVLPSATIEQMSDQLKY